MLHRQSVSKRMGGNIKANMGWLGRADEVLTEQQIYTLSWQFGRDDVSEGSTNAGK